MLEDKIVAETNVDNQAVQEVATTEEIDNNVEFNDGGEETLEKEVQSKEKNSEYARIRREQETQAKIDKAKMDAVIDALDGKNPYTNEEIKDEFDYKEYLQMKEMAKSGHDPLSDYSKYMKEKERNALLQKQKEEETNQKARGDIEAFKSEHPEENLKELLDDDAFKSILRGVGNLNKAYDIYNGIKVKFESQIENKYAQRIANGNASVGSQRNTYESQSKDFNSMTKAEFEQAIQDAKDGKLRII